MVIPRFRRKLNWKKETIPIIISTCEIYLKDEMITEKSAGVILISDNFHTSDPSVLLLHYLSGHWDFPKGNIEIDETEMQAATRELKEETGIEIFTFLPGFRHVLNYKYTRKSILISKQVTLFLASTNVNKVEISHEHIGYQWMEINAAVNQLTYSNAKTALTSAINFLTQNRK